MDQTLIFELSSDDEVGLDNSSLADKFDWVTKLLEEVGAEDHDPISNGGFFDCAINNKDVGVDDDGNDSDDVVVVGEVIVQNPKKPRNLVLSNDESDDDDCVMLDGDPDKQNKHKDEVKDSEDDSDDLLIVGEKGQVACRDYPHARHLCAKFPFSSTSHESRCDLCHCYVCDSLAPCSLWGSGVSSIDHCHATDKEEFWKLERKRLRQVKNPPLPMPITKPIAGSVAPPAQMQQIFAEPNQLLRSTSTCGVSSTFGLPNIIRSQRSSIAVASNRFPPHLLKNCNGNAQVQGNRGASLAPKTPSHPVFKRSGLTNRTVVANRPTYRAPNNVNIPSSHHMFKRSGLTGRTVVANRSTYCAPKNLNVPYLQLPNQQITGNLTENNSANSTMSSLHLDLNPNFCMPSPSSISPCTMPPQLRGYSQPSPHTPTSQFHGNGHSAAVASNSPYTYTFVNQMQNVPGLVLPHDTNLQNSTTLCNEQPSAVTQNICGPNISCSTPDIRSSIRQRSHQTSAEQSYCSPIFSVSMSNALDGVAQSCQQPAAENSFAQGGVPMHEILPSLEHKDSSENMEELAFDFENWLQDSDSILGSQEESFLLDMNDQALAPTPVDAGMLYIDFETSWKGLTHS
ncbi:uncharacterized protein LOC104899316 isoform X1 [Beta vulgaris subsp. vulgaris]|uniref:uncharacterized protein LOC104899316 isoform X1 n=1 Tax=Beta vulgaris subsp. vulgaris TaxID=3555 RepID=UPI0020369B15|nr:uncharacterized protein LOC104899316 isoform X1 [Beta vulgaris subsp. vulgaris]